MFRLKGEPDKYITVLALMFSYTVRDLYSSSQLISQLLMSCRSKKVKPHPYE